MRKLTYFYSLLLAALFLLPWSAKADPTPIWSEDFEGGSMPTGWTTDGSGNWSVGTGDYSSSTGAGQGTYNAKITHGSTGDVTKLISPVIDLSGYNSALLSFMHVHRSWGSDKDQLRVYYRTSSTGTWVLISGQEYTSAQSTWKTESDIVLPNVNSTYQIAFEMTDGYGYGVGIDNVQILPPPSCPNPGTPSASNIDETTATISWTQGGTEDTWNLRYKKSTASVWTEVNGLTSTTYELTGLEAGKITYNYEVQADCGGGDKSQWAAGTAFQTDCGTITIPTNGWSYNFDGDAVNSIPNCWKRITSNSYYPCVDNTYSHSASNSVIFVGYNYHGAEYVVLPEMATDIENLKLSFWYKSNSSTYTKEMSVGYITNAETATYTTAVYTPVQTLTDNTDWSNVTNVLFTGAPSGARIAFYMKGTKSSSSYQGRLYIDDVKVESAIDCSKPSVTSIEQTGTGTATVTWGAKDGVTSYQYCYVESGEEPDWSGNLTIGTNSVELTSVPAGNYDFYVKCVCGGDPSDAAPFTISACMAIENVQHTNDVFNGTTVTWANNGSGPWDVYYSTDGGANWTKANTDNITSSTYALTGLTPGNNYTIEVRNDCGSKASTTYSPVYTAPAGVAVAAANISDVTARATWSAVSDVTSGYKYIYQTAGSAAPNETAWTSAATTSNTYADLSGLTVNTAYDFYVCSNYGGNLSSITGPVNFTTVAQQPANVHLTADPSDTEATITWEAGGVETQWQYVCVTKNTTPEWTGVDPIGTSALPVTVDNLNALTDYDFYVRSYYSSTVQSDPVKLPFKTDCGVNALGWKEEFGSSLSQCWTNESEYGATWQVYSYSDESYSGNYSLYYNFKRYNSSSSYDAVLTTPSVAISNEAVLSFYWKSAANANVEVSIKASGEAAEVLGSLTPTSATTYAQQQYNIASKYVGKTVNFIFRGKGNGNSGSSRYFRLDDVEVKVQPCDAPDFAAANVVETTDGATVSCDADKWNLKYKLTSAEDIPANWTVVENITTASSAITGCTPGSEYEVQVQAVCSATRSSAWTASQTFTPQCLAPFNFSTTALSDNSASITWEGNAQALRYKVGAGAWNEVAPATATSHSFTGLDAETTYTVQVKATCEEGDNWSAEYQFTTKCAPITITKAASYEADFTTFPACWEKSETTYPSVTAEKELKFYANEVNQTAILPAFSNDIATLVLKFNYKNYSSWTGYGKLQVGYINTSDEFVPFGDVLTNKSAYAATEIIFEGVTGAKNIAVRFLDNANSEAFSYIKDVVVELAPTCYAPATLNDATDITATGAKFTWTASTKANETQYQYVCVLAGETPIWDGVAPTNELSATLSGLTANTEYDFYVRSYCATDDQSEVVTKSFTTECASVPVASMPFEEDFTGLTDIPECWTTHKGSYYNIYVDNEELHFNSGKTATLQTVALPKLDAPLADLAISFNYRGSEGSNYGKVQVGYLTDKKDNSTFVAVGEPLTVTASAKQAVVPFTGVDANAFIAIRYTGGTSEGNLYIDNIRVATTLALADAVDNSATLNNNLGQTLDVVIGRTLICDEDFNTLCLPFDLPNLAGTPLAGGALWAFKYANVENGELLVRIIEAESIEAGKPYLITFPSGSDIENPLFKNVTISVSAGVAVGDEAAVQFIGILKPEAFTTTGEDVHKKLFVAANGHLAWASVANELKSFRAYFQTTENVGGNSVPSSMPARIVKHDPTITGVENVNGEVQAIKVLENNQVVIIRNGVKYTIQGQVISK